MLYFLIFKILKNSFLYLHKKSAPLSFSKINADPLNSFLSFYQPSFFLFYPHPFWPELFPVFRGDKGNHPFVFAKTFFNFF